MLILKYHLTEDEYYEYNYYSTWSAASKRKVRIRYYLRVVGQYTAIAAIYIYSKSRNEEVVADIIIFSIIAVIYFLMVPFFIKKSVRRRVKDILQQPENAHILDESEVMLIDTGIVDKDALSETRYSWDAIVKKEETQNAYYLYTNSYHAIVIPKRVLLKPHDRIELENLLNRYLPLSSDL